MSSVDHATQLAIEKAFSEAKDYASIKTDEASKKAADAQQAAVAALTEAKEYAAAKADKGRNTAIGVLGFIMIAATFVGYFSLSGFAEQEFLNRGGERIISTVEEKAHELESLIADISAKASEMNDIFERISEKEINIGADIQRQIQELSAQVGVMRNSVDFMETEFANLIHGLNRFGAERLDLYTKNQSELDCFSVSNGIRLGDEGTAYLCITRPDIGGLR